MNLEERENMVGIYKNNVSRRFSACKLAVIARDITPRGERKYVVDYIYGVR